MSRVRENKSRQLGEGGGGGGGGTGRRGRGKNPECLQKTHIGVAFAANSVTLKRPQPARSDVDVNPSIFQASGFFSHLSIVFL